MWSINGVDVAGCQPIEGERGHVRLSDPARLEFWAGGYDHLRRRRQRSGCLARRVDSTGRSMAGCKINDLGRHGLSFRCV
jgi:hypothetical protein